MDYLCAKKRFVLLLIVVLAICCGAGGGFFLHHFPEISISQDALYGTGGTNLHDLSVTEEGKLTATSDDPWITVTLEEPVPVAVIRISASDVDDLGGHAQIFNMDTWDVRTITLYNGSNYVYCYSRADTWATQYLRLDLLQVSGASCRISMVDINPPIFIFLMGATCTLIPILAVLIIAHLICSLIRKKMISGVDNASEMQRHTERLIFGSMAAAAFSTYFVTVALRFSQDASTYFLVFVVLVALFLARVPDIGKRNRALVLVFSVILSLAAILSSHISIGDNPYSDLMDVSKITSFGRRDIVGVIVNACVIDRGIRLFLRFILWLKKRLLSLRWFSRGKISFGIPMAVLLLCWLPYFILHYPGFILGDSVNQIEQAIGAWTLNNHHPILHTMFIRLCLWIGSLYGDLTLGVAVYVLVQMLYVSYALGILIEFLSARGLPWIVSCLIMAFYGLTPFFGQVSIAVWKDPIFGASAVLLTVRLFEYFETRSKQKVATKKAALGRIGADTFLLCFSRNNGAYAVAFCIFILLICILLRKNLRKQLLSVGSLLMAVIIAYFAVTGPVANRLYVQPSEKVESVGIFLNQMASVAASDDGVMSEADRDFMGQLLPLDKYRDTYRPCAVDLLKWDPDFNSAYLEDNMGTFFRTYISMGLKNPAKYIGAWALMTFGYWAPNRWEMNTDDNNLAKGNFGDLYNSDLSIQTVNPVDPPDNLLYKR